MSTPAPSYSRLSASSVRALIDCSLAFYYSRVLKLPEKTWAKTVMGSLCHSIFECLRHPRHRHHFDTITAPKTSVNHRASPAVARLVRMWQDKHGIEQKLIDELDGMLYVGLLCIDFHWTGANKDEKTGEPITHGPEHEFNLVLEDGTIVRGFIDDMAEEGDIMVIRDFKSAGSKPTVADTVNSIQGMVYQLYVWKHFCKLARVEFVYLRHGPTKRTPEKHLMVVEPSSPEVLAGLEAYLCSMSQRLKTFGLDDAYVSPCSDLGFCQRVCSHYAPHPYWVVLAPTDPEGLTPVSSHLSPEAANKALKPGERVVERAHKGCTLRWREPAT